MKTLAVDNRKALAGLLCVAIVGVFTMSDWQAIGTDPCSTFCIHDISFENKSISTNISYSCSGDVEIISLNPLFNLSVNDVADACEAASTSKYTCFWNPRSRVTGKYCSDCTQRCRSNQKSLYFAQLCVGIVMIIMVLQIVTVVLTVVASDYTPTKYQV